MAYARHPLRVLKISNRKKNNAKWVLASQVPANPSSRESYMSQQQLKDLVVLIVKDAYARVGDAIYQQKKGIPMGVNPASFFANIYLFTYELGFFQQLLNLDSDHSRRVLHAFRYSGRLTDDVLIITHESQEFVRQYFYTDQMAAGIRGIYPSSLNLQDSSCENRHESNFLDLHIQPAFTTHGPLQTTLFDKRKQPAFMRRLKTIRFPAPYSMIARRCKLNCFDSQFIRYSRLISPVHEFIEAIARLMHELVVKGYQPVDILKRCKFQIRDNPHLYGTAPGTSGRYRRASGLFQAIRRRFDFIMRVSPAGR